MTRLILVRHGETEHNRNRLTLGRAEIPLNVRGIAQARAVAASFLRPPAAIYTSPLRRAADTAGAIALATGASVAVEPDLVEMEVGDMEHLAPADLRARYPDFLKQWLSPDAGDARMPGGETLREVQDRAWAAIERIRVAHPDGEVVAVTHNFVILTVVCRAIGLPHASFRALRVEVGSRTVLELSDRGNTLLSLNSR